MGESAGNADEELGVIQKGIDYKINALKQTWVGFGQDMIDRGAFGDVIDALTTISEKIVYITEKAGLLRVAIMGAFGFMGVKGSLTTSNAGGGFISGLLGLGGENVLSGISGSFINKKFNRDIRNALNNWDGSGDGGLGIDFNNEKYKYVNQRYIESAKNLNEKLKTAESGAGTEALYDGYIQQTEQATKATSKFSTIARTAGAMVTNLAVGFAVSEVLHFGKALLTVNKNMQKLQENAKTALGETKKTIDSYKTSIQEQAEILTNEASSHEQVISAKERLSSIQDEIIDKYGEYGESGQVIQGITDLINGQTDAVGGLSSSLDNLSSKDFSKIMRDLDSGEGLGWAEKAWNWLLTKWRSIGSNEDITNSRVLFNNMSNGFSAISNLTTKDFLEKVFSTESEFYKEYGIFEGKTLSDFFDIIENNREKFNDIFDSEEYEDLKDYYNTNKDFYDQYVLNEKVLKDYKDQYDEFQKINTDYMGANDDIGKRMSLIDYGDLIKGLDGADEYIIDYFRNLNSELDSSFAEMDFDNIININQGKFMDIGEAIDAVYDGVGENIRYFNELTADDSQKEMWNVLKALADEYGVSIDSIIDKMAELNYITTYKSSDDAYRNLDTTIKQDGIQVTDNVRSMLDDANDIKTNEGKELNKLIKNNLGSSLFDENQWLKFATEVRDGMTFGNIDFSKRKPLVWNDKNVKKYSEQLKDFAPDILENNGLKKIVSSALGGFDSKLLHNVENRGQKKENLEMYYSFTPFIEDENGNIIDMLNGSQVDNYINTLFNKAQKDGKITAKEVLELDIEGIETKGVKGGKISNLLAYVGYSEKNAELVAQLMHYSGQSGSIMGAMSTKDMLDWNIRNITNASTNIQEADTTRQDAIDKANADYNKKIKATDTDTKSLEKNKEAYEKRNELIKEANDNYRDTLRQQREKIWQNQTSALKTYNNMLKEVNKTQGSQSYSAKKDRESIYALMNSMLDFSMQALNLGSVKIDIETEKTNVEAVTTALSEMNSVGGLSEETINGLTSAFSGMDDWDKSKLFEKTAEGISINREELERLNEEYANKNMRDTEADLEGLITEYKLLADEIANCSDAEQKASLIQQASGIRDQITELDNLRSQYEGLTSSYAKWQRALSTTNNNDMFKNEGDQYDNMKKLRDEGWWGNDELNAYVELFRGKDWKTKTNADGTLKYKNIGEVFDSLTTEKVEGTDHTLMDYFTYTVDDNGNRQSDMTVEGLDTFIKDMETLRDLGKLDGMLDKDGNFNFGKLEFKNGEWTTGLDVLADAFGTTTEQMEIFFKALQEKGEDVHFGSGVDEMIAGADSKIAEAKASIKEELKKQGTTEEEILMSYSLELRPKKKNLDKALKDYENTIKDLREKLDKATDKEKNEIDLELGVVEEAYRDNLYRAYNKTMEESLLPNIDITDEMQEQGDQDALSYIGGFKSIAEDGGALAINLKVGSDADKEVAKQEAESLITVFDDMIKNYDGFSESILSKSLDSALKSAYENAENVTGEYTNMADELNIVKGTMEKIQTGEFVSPEELARLETFIDVIQKVSGLEGFGDYLKELGMSDEDIKALSGSDATKEATTAVNNAKSAIEKLTSVIEKRNTQEENKAKDNEDASGNDDGGTSNENNEENTKNANNSKYNGNNSDSYSSTTESGSYARDKYGVGLKEQEESSEEVANNFVKAEESTSELAKTTDASIEKSERAMENARKMSMEQSKEKEDKEKEGGEKGSNKGDGESSNKNPKEPKEPKEPKQEQTAKPEEYADVIGRQLANNKYFNANEKAIELKEKENAKNGANDIIKGVDFGKLYAKAMGDYKVEEKRDSNIDMSWQDDGKPHDLDFYTKKYIEHKVEETRKKRNEEKAKENIFSENIESANKSLENDPYAKAMQKQAVSESYEKALKAKDEFLNYVDEDKLPKKTALIFDSAFKEYESGNYDSEKMIKVFNNLAEVFEEYTNEAKKDSNDKDKSNESQNKDTGYVPDWNDLNKKRNLDYYTQEYIKRKEYETRQKREQEKAKEKNFSENIESVNKSLENDSYAKAMRKRGEEQAEAQKQAEKDQKAQKEILDKTIESMNNKRKARDEMNTIMAEEKAKAEEEAKKKAQEQAEAEEEAKRNAEKEAEEAKKKAKEEAEAQAKAEKEAQEQAKKQAEAEEKARKEAEEKAKQAEAEEAKQEEEEEEGGARKKYTPEKAKEYADSIDFTKLDKDERNKKAKEVLNELDNTNFWNAYREWMSVNLNKNLPEDWKEDKDTYITGNSDVREALKEIELEKKRRKYGDAIDESKEIVKGVSKNIEESMFGKSDNKSEDESNTVSDNLKKAGEIVGDLGKLLFGKSFSKEIADNLQESESSTKEAEKTQTYSELARERKNKVGSEDNFEIHDLELIELPEGTTVKINDQNLRNADFNKINTMDKNNAEENKKIEDLQGRINSIEDEFDERYIKNAFYKSFDPMNRMYQYGLENLINDDKFKEAYAPFYENAKKEEQSFLDKYNTDSLRDVLDSMAISVANSMAAYENYKKTKEYKTLSSDDASLEEKVSAYNSLNESLRKDLSVNEEYIDEYQKGFELYARLYGADSTFNKLHLFEDYSAYALLEGSLAYKSGDILKSELDSITGEDTNQDELTQRFFDNLVPYLDFNTIDGGYTGFAQKYLEKGLEYVRENKDGYYPLSMNDILGNDNYKYNLSSFSPIDLQNAIDRIGNSLSEEDKDEYNSDVDSILPSLKKLSDKEMNDDEIDELVADELKILSKWDPDSFWGDVYSHLGKKEGLKDNQAPIEGETTSFRANTANKSDLANATDLSFDEMVSNINTAFTNYQDMVSKEVEKGNKAFKQDFDNNYEYFKQLDEEFHTTDNADRQSEIYNEIMNIISSVMEQQAVQNATDYISGIDVSSLSVSGLESLQSEVNAMLQGTNYELVIDANGELAIQEIQNIEAEAQNANATVNINTQTSGDEQASMEDGKATVVVDAETTPMETKVNAKVSEVNSMTGTVKINADSSAFDTVVASVRTTLASITAEIATAQQNASNIKVPKANGTWTGTFGFYGGTMSAFADGSHDVTVGRDQTALVNELGK